MERNLTDKDKEKILNFGALSYSNKQMSVILNIEIDEVNSLMADENSSFYKLYERGMFIGKYTVDLKLLELAQSGDLKAMAKIDVLRARKK